MTTQPHLPEPASEAAARPALRLAPPVPEHDVDFDAFVRSYEPRLRRLVMRRIGDLCEAEEITQETLLRAYQHRGSFSTEDELMAWSTVVAQRLVIDRVRVRGRSVAVPDVPETARLGRDTADVVVARHEARAALESLEAIPTRQAAILWAREVEGLHYEEIAERFGISEPAVRSLLHRGRKALRVEFKNRTGSLPLSGLAPFAPWLIALKAAGKVRGVAKATAKAPAGAVAALSLSALVAVGIGGFFAGGGTGEARSVAIRPAQGGSARVTTAFEPAEPVAREVAALTSAPFRKAAAAARPATPGAHVAAPWITLHVSRVPGLVHSNGFKGAVLQIGPDLADNPARVKNIKISQEYVSCSQLGIPSNAAVTCTQQSPPEDAGLPAVDTPRDPSITEGATR